MSYISDRYEGYTKIPTSFLQDELLCSKDEFQDVRKHLRDTLQVQKLPGSIDSDLFCDTVELYLDRLV